MQYTISWPICFFKALLVTNSWNLFVPQIDLYTWISSQFFPEIYGVVYNTDNAIHNMFYDLNFRVLFDCINPFLATGPFQYPLRTSENQWFSDVFRGCWRSPVAWNGLTHSVNPNVGIVWLFYLIHCFPPSGFGNIYSNFYESLLQKAKQTTEI